ncbi:MAG: hypothetical protein LBT92_03375 [Rickettsiales bacterium]|nr:hypothetical protein [Rickettsiales bacterium]
MDDIKKYLDIITKTNEIALATSIDNVPNVRILNVIVKPEQPQILYFASDRSCRKVSEFAQNNAVAFTSVPHGEIAHVRSNKSSVQKSKLTLADVQGQLIATIPGYDETIAAIGETLDIFEIHVKEAVVIPSIDENELAFIKF